MFDAVPIALVGVAISGGAAIGAAFIGKRSVSKADLDNALTNKFNAYVAATDLELRRVKDVHADCEVHVKGLRGIVYKLVKALRQKGIALPAFEPHEEVLLIEDRSFHEANGQNRSN